MVHQKTTNLKAFTIPSKLFANNEILGTIQIELEDEGQGVLSGELKPTEYYNKYAEFLRDASLNHNENNLATISRYTQTNKFKVIADDGTEFKEPLAGLIVYDFENEPIQVELTGIKNDIWGPYFD